MLPAIPVILRRQPPTDCHCLPWAPLLGQTWTSPGLHGDGPRYVSGGLCWQDPGCASSPQTRFHPQLDGEAPCAMRRGLPGNVTPARPQSQEVGAWPSSKALEPMSGEAWGGESLAPTAAPLGRYNLGHWGQEGPCTREQRPHRHGHHDRLPGQHCISWSRLPDFRALVSQQKAPPRAQPSAQSTHTGGDQLPTHTEAMERVGTLSASPLAGTPSASPVGDCSAPSVPRPLPWPGEMS